MDFDGLATSLGQIGGLFAGIAAVLAGIKAIIDVFRVKKAQPGDAAAQIEALQTPRQPVAQPLDATAARPPRKRVTNRKILLRILVLWVMVAVVWGLTVWFDDNISKVTGAASTVMLGLLGLMLALSLLYILRLVYRGVVYIFIH